MNVVELTARQDAEKPGNRKDLPETNGCELGSIPCSLRRIAAPEIFAQLVQSADKHSAVLQHLAEAISTGQVTDFKIVEVEVRSGLPIKDLSARLERNDTVLFNLDPGVAVKNGGAPHNLPAGYPLVDISGFHPDSRLMSAGGVARFLEIPRAEFHILFECDLRLAGALQKLIHQAHPAAPMPEHSREQIRHTRGQNISALVTREGIRAVTGPDGIQDILNPNGCCVESPFEARLTSRIIDPVQQRWALIRGVSTLATHLNREKLTGLARDARAWVEERDISEEGRAGMALYAFRLMLREQEKKLISEQLPNLLRAVEQLPFDEKDRGKVFGRMLEIAWLGDGLKQERRPVPLKEWDRALSSILKSSTERFEGSLPGVLKDLDRRVETLFDARSRRQEKGILSIAVQQLPSALYLRPPPGKEIPRTDPCFKALEDLQLRLQRGETSAVGGAAYAAMRFPDDALEKVCSGEVPVVLYNGCHQDGLAYVHSRFGSRQVNPYVVENALAMNLQGAYGSFSRSWVFFRDGSSVLLVSHVGKSRQLSNAGALLLYSNRENERVPLDKLILVDGIQDIGAEIKASVAEALRKSELEMEGKTVLGEKLTGTKNLPTQALVLLHPRQLEATLHGEVEIRSYLTKALGKVHVGFIRNADGAITRLLMPTVGGGGLYGDTAGHFIEAIFDRTVVSNIIPHVLFNATAGGFAGTAETAEFKKAGVLGLAARAKPDEFLMPQLEIHDDRGAVPMTTLLAAAKEIPHDPALDERIERELQTARVHRVDRHFSISHPGDETYQKIDRLVREDLVASIDVEGGPTQRAILKVREDRPDATFTPIYSFSDDPRSGRQERYKMLAYGGPLHDNSKPDSKLNPVLLSLMDLAYACRGA